MRVNFLFAFVLLFILCSLKVRAADTLQVVSPDGRTNFDVWSYHGQLFFSVRSSGTYILTPSTFVFSVNQILLTQDVHVQKIDRSKRHETFPVSGPHSLAVVDYTDAIITLVSGKGRLRSSLEVRVFNNGVAYRHRLSAPRTGGVPAESTVFHLPASSSLWYHDLTMHYEGVHVKKTIDSLEPGAWIAPPATYKLPNGSYASITEAALVGYPGMALQANGEGGVVIRLAHEQPTSYPYKLRYSAEDTARLKMPPIFYGEIKTPWRVVLLGNDLNSLVNNDIIASLNTPPDRTYFAAGVQPSWIKPGRAVWKYLNGGGDGTLEVMKNFTDGAAALGFEHNILEGFWTRWTDAQLKELIVYAKQKGVGIWLWKHSKSLRTPEARDSFFRKCHLLGVAGAKIDFFDHEAKETIDLYTSIVKTAAQYRILLDFHGANKPTGLERTYPNILVYEAVKGMEASKLADRATHETTIPFTRFLAGPAEYTVLHFGERRKNTTWAHQIASAAILSAPLLTYAANPDTILMNPAVEIIKRIPSTWDETLVLPPSEIGELAVYARRKGDTWFLAVMNGVVPKKVNLSLTFLKGDYKALVAKDDHSNPASVIMEQTVYAAADTLEVDLVSGGGFIAMFSK